MALDTRSKRASALGALRPWVPAAVLPDGTLDQGDRQHVAMTYSGILAAGAAAPTFVHSHHGGAGYADPKQHGAGPGYEG